MAAKPPHVLLIDCPPTRHDDGGDGWRQQRQLAWRNNFACQRACRVAALILVVAAMITGLVFLAMFLERKFPSKDPVHTVAISGVSGLDVLSPPPPPPPSSPSPAADADDDYYYSSPATLSPVFNLTFQIDNTQNSRYEECVPGLSRAEVSYGDAFLAAGSVPPFCAGKMRTSGPVAARAWGQDVAVPRFLRDQLAAELAAGDASVDVKVTMPGGDVLSCKPKIGDGTFAVCRLDHL